MEKKHVFKLLLLLIAILAATGMVTSVYGVIATPPQTGGFTTVLTGLGAGLIMGLVYAVIGYSAAPPDETFDPAKFGLSLTIGLVVGVVASQLGISFDSAFNLLAILGTIATIQKLYNIVLKKVAPLHAPVASAATG